MSAILATVDIEDLATPKVARIKDALTDLVQTQQQVIANGSAYAGGTQSAIAAMGASATAAKANSDAMAVLAERYAAALPVYNRVGEGLNTFAQHLQASQAAINLQKGTLETYIAMLGALALAAQQGAIPLQVQAAALADLAKAAQEGAPGLQQHEAALRAMAQQLTTGVPLTKAQTDELNRMALGMAEANHATLMEVSAMEALLTVERAEIAMLQQRAAVAAALARQLQAGSTVTKLQHDAMVELNREVQASTVYSDKLKAISAELARTLETGATVTGRHAAQLKVLTQGMTEAAQRTEAARQSLQDMSSTAALLQTVLAALSAYALKGLLEEAGMLAARVQTLGVVMLAMGKNAGISSQEMRVQVESVKRLGITTQESSDAVLQFVQANLKLTDASKLARVAQDLAVVANENSSQTVNRLVRAIQTQHLELLRAVGITTTIAQVTQSYASEVGKSVRTLNQAERQQAVLNFILKEGAKVAGTYELAMSTTGKQMSSFARYVEEAKLKLGEGLVPVFGIAVRTATALLKIWLDLPPALQHIVTAALAATTVVASLMAVLAAGNILAATQAFIRLTAAIKLFSIGVQAGYGIMTSAGVAFGVINVWLVAIAAVIGVVTAAFVLYNKQVEISIEKDLQWGAQLDAEMRSLESNAKQVDASSYAVQKLTVEKEKLADKTRLTRDEQDRLAVVTAKLADEQNKLDRATSSLTKLAPEAVAAIRSQATAYQDMAEAIQKAIERRRELARQAIGGAEAGLALAQKEEARARQASAEAQAHLTRLLDVQKQFAGTGVQAVNLNRQIELVRERVKDTGAAMTEAAGKTDLFTRQVADLNNTLHPERLAQVNKNLVAVEFGNAKEQYKDLAARVREAGKSMDYLKNAVDVPAFKSRLAEVNSAWDRHRAEVEKDGKRIEAAIKSMRLALEGGERETKVFEALQNLLNQSSLSAEQYGERLWRARNFLEKFGASAEAKLPQFEKLRKNLEDLRLMQLGGVTPAEVRAFEDLEQVLQAVSHDQALYGAALRDNAALIKKFSMLTEEQKASLGGLPAVTKAAAQAIDAFADAERRATRTDLAAKERAASEVLLKATRERVDGQRELEYGWMREREQLMRDGARAIEALDKEMFERQVVARMSERDQAIYAEQERVKAIQRTRQDEVRARQLDLEDRRRAMNERLRMREREIEDIARLALEERKIRALALEEELEIARRRGIPEAIRDAEIRLQVFQEYNGKYLDLIYRQRDESLRIAAQIRDDEGRILDERGEAYGELDAKAGAAMRRVATESGMAIKRMVDGSRIIRQLGTDIVTSFLNGLTRMISGAESFKDVLKGIWNQIKEALLGIFASLLKEWILNLARMAAASKATQLTGFASNAAAGAMGAIPIGMGAGGAAAGGVGSVGMMGMQGWGGRLLGGAVGGAVGGMVGYGVGYSTGSRTAGFLSGAGTGAAVGGMVGGPIGAGIGALIGGIAGLFGAGKAKREAEEARKAYIEAAGGIQELERRAKEAGVTLTRFFKADDPKELQKAVEKLDKALALQAAKDGIAKTYDELVRLDKQAQLVGYDIRKLYNAKTVGEFNAEQEKLNKLLEAQRARLEALAVASQGLAQWATGFTQTLARGFEKAFPSKEALEEFLKKYQEAVDKGFKGTVIEFAKQEKLAVEQLARLEDLVQSNQQEFTNLGIVAAATFAGILRETGDVVQAMNAIAPTIDQLIKAQDEWGFTADATFDSLIRFRRIVKENEDIFNSLGGITQALKGLSEAGWLTQQSFDALAGSATARFTELVARTGDQNMAMLAMQPTLQALWEAQKKYGFTVDENTQKLIDQGVEQGLVGANMQSVNQKILDVLGLIAQVLGVMPDKLAALGLAGDNAGRRVDAGMDNAVGGIEKVIRRAGDAQREIYAMGRAGEEAGAMVEDGATGAAHGHSPTGIKEIVLMLKKSQAAMEEFSTVFHSRARAIETASAGIVKRIKFENLGGSKEDELRKLRPYPVGWVEPDAPGTTLTIEVTQEGPVITVNAIDNANMEEAWRTKILPEYLRHMDHNADQIAELTENYISRHRRRVS